MQTAMDAGRSLHKMKEIDATEGDDSNDVCGKYQRDNMRATRNI